MEAGRSLLSPNLPNQGHRRNRPCLCGSSLSKLSWGLEADLFLDSRQLIQDGLNNSLWQLSQLSFDASKSLLALSLPFFYPSKSFLTLSLKAKSLLIVARNLLHEGSLIPNQQGHCLLKVNTCAGTVSRSHVRQI